MLVEKEKKRKEEKEKTGEGLKKEKEDEETEKSIDQEVGTSLRVPTIEMFICLKAITNF